MIRKRSNTNVTDLPGIYSLSPYTSEEIVTRNFLIQDQPKGIINIVDATNLSRSLFFTTQLLELKIPVVVALNKNDLNEKKETKIDVKTLSEKLGCPVVETVSTTGSTSLLSGYSSLTISFPGCGSA